jgi:hypothetical protein
MFQRHDVDRRIESSSVKRQARQIADRIQPRVIPLLIADA